MPALKLAARVKAYRLGAAVYLQDAEKVYAIEDFPDPELLSTFVAWLSQGVTEEAARARCQGDTQPLFDDLVVHLRQQGFLEENERAAPPSLLPTRQYPERVLNEIERERLAQSRLTLFGDCDSLADELRRLLAYHAIDIDKGSESMEPGAPSSPRLALFVKTSSVSEERVLAFNRQAFATGYPWLAADVSLGRYVSYGPLISPPEPPCYQCFCERRWINQDTVLRHAISRTQSIQQGTPVSYGWQHTLLAALLTHAIIAFFVGAKPLVYGHVVYVDLYKTEIWHEPLVRYPCCPVCGGSLTAASWQR